MFEERLSVRIPCRQNPNKSRKNDANFIEVEVKYTLGGTNWFTGKPEPRGYYLHCSPIYVANRCITYQGFSGIKYCLLEVPRKSKIRQIEARQLAEKYVQQLIDRVCHNNNLEVCGNA